MTNIISVNHLSKQYKKNSDSSYLTLRESISNVFNSKSTSTRPREFWALRNVSFTIKRGEIVGIIGKNGAGKSTLLKILSKITYPTKGMAIINGRVGSLLEVGTGFHQELTGRENIYLNGSILGMTRQEITSKFNQIVDFAGVSEFLDTPVKRYSSGMQVRLAFSVAAHLDPEILLIDEVLSVGDAEFQKRSLGKMEEIATNGKRTILFVSHNLAAVRKLCTRCIYIEEGKIVADGNVAKVVNKYLGSSAKSSTSLIKRKDRSGSGKMLLAGYTLRDKNRDRVNTFVSGETAHIELKVLPKKDHIKKVDVTLQILDSEGNIITTLDNSLTEDRLKNKSSTFDCIIPNLPLVKGTYYVNSRIKADNYVADKILSAFSFSVISENFFPNSTFSDSYGKVFIKHNWESK